MRTEVFKSLFTAALVIVAAAGCESREPAVEAPPVAPEAAGTSPSASSVFESPDAAFAALMDAARSGSADSVRIVLGMDSDDVLSAGDPVQFKNDVEAVVARYDERHETVENENGGYILLIGENDWPFSIPVVSDADGWRFDLAAGRQELDDRRIGRNELAAIQVCRAVVDAQEEYQRLNPVGNGAYAAKFLSDPGKKNGLYWTTQEGEPQSPLGELVAIASEEGYERGTAEEPAAYHGYHYRILTEQGPYAPGRPRDYFVDGQLTGGFAVIAWPAEYGRSGIMSFMVNPLGVVYEADLGENTGQIAAEMKSFDPTPEWNVCLD